MNVCVWRVRIKNRIFQWKHINIRFQPFFTSFHSILLLFFHAFLFAGYCATTVGKMAIWEWLHIYNMVPAWSHQFSEYRTRKTVSLLVSRIDNEAVQRATKKHNIIKKWKPKKRRQNGQKIEMYYRYKSQCFLFFILLAPKRNILICNDYYNHCILFYRYHSNQFWLTEC